MAHNNGSQCLSAHRIFVFPRVAHSMEIIRKDRSRTVKDKRMALAQAPFGYLVR